MKFKKILCAGASAVMIFASSVIPTNAQTGVLEEYFKDYSKVMQWEKMDSTSDVHAELEYKQENFKAGYKIKANSKYDKNAKSIYANINFEAIGSATPIPNIEVYMGEDGSVYVNKEAVQEFTELFYLMGEKKQVFNKEFVKIKLPQDATGTAMNMRVLEQYYKDNVEFTNKLIDFLKGIDIGVDLNFRKENGQYVMTWDSNKMVDVVDGYIRYVLSNFDAYVKFYKDVLGIDYYKMIADMVEAGGESASEAQIKEKIKTELAEAKVSYEKEVVPLLPMVKEMIQGSTFTMTERYVDYDDSQEGMMDTYDSDLNLSVRIDLNKMEEIAPMMGVKNEAAQKENVVSGVLVVKQSAKEDSNLQIQLPKEYDVLDVEALMKEREDALNKKMMEENPPTQETRQEEPEFKLDVTNNMLFVNYMGKKEAVKIETKIENGTLYVKKDDNSTLNEILEDMQGDFVPFREAMEKEGFTVTWDKQTRTVNASME